MTINISAANITSIRLADQNPRPTAPASNFIQLYADVDGNLGTVKGGGGGILIATSPATGDYTLTVTGTGTAARLNANQTFSGTNTFSSDIVLANGIGIDFSATSGTGTSELFDDYEEGNWTPVVVGSGTAGTATYTVNAGRYTKIGRMVHIQADLGWNSGSGGGSLYVQGLPFTSTSGIYAAVTIGYWENIALTASTVAGAYVQFSSQEIRFSQYPLGGGAFSFVAYDAAGRMFIQGSYIV